ncbi:MAG TPA: right-handed parallel beta-helix repeat-containing protein [Verrucomicrobiae bacterium]|nr:right-handed parallel beta-helix repeat-containing protein [Verrucomicrobiae bacterium]
MNKIICILIWLCWFLSPAPAAEFWVSPDGNDGNPGTRTQPFASVAIALRQARELRRLEKVTANEPVRIILRGGAYPLTSPLWVRSEDSGTETSPTIIEAAPGEQPALSGGSPVTGWKKASVEIPGLPETAQGNVWMADAPTFGGRMLEFRQLWVNGRKAIRAREPNGDTLNHLIAWDKTNQAAWISAGSAGVLAGQLRGGKLAGKMPALPGQIEMIIDQVWEIAVLRVKTMRVEGDKVCLTFQQPESKLEFEHPWPPVTVNTNYQAPFFLANAIEFLDQPGEWFEDVSAGKVYYWPRLDEDLTQASVIAPAVETLVQVTGSLDRSVANVHFKGVTFEYTTWLRPSEAGDVPLQAGMYFLDAYRLKPKGTAYHPGLDNQAWIGRPPAGMSVKDAIHVEFERCRFEHMAAAGLDFESGTHDNLVQGCVFRDLGGNGLQMGKFSDAGVETHVPYNPKDERVICTHEKILNNLVTDCGTEDWGSVGICVGYGREIAIEHNEVCDLPYTGISVGWGWNKAANCMRDNVIHANHIHQVATRLGDTGGIYTLSAQPGTVISENSVHDIKLSPYVPDPDHWFYLYLDEGSSFITVRDNWCPTEKFMKNANGPGNHWENNGPMVSQKIKDAAGLEPAFRDLLSELENDK